MLTDLASAPCLSFSSVSTLFEKGRAGALATAGACLVDRAMEKSELVMDDPASTSTGGTSSGLSPLEKPLKRVDSLDEESNRVKGMPRSFSSKV